MSRENINERTQTSTEVREWQIYDSRWTCDACGIVAETFARRALWYPLGWAGVTTSRQGPEQAISQHWHVCPDPQCEAEIVARAELWLKTES